MKKLILILLICSPAMLFAQWNNDPGINTKISDTIGMQVQPKIVVNDNGESYISWFSDFGGWQFDVYMQRLDKSGNKLWSEGGLLISDHPTNTWTTDYDLVLDKQENAILITQDERTGNSNVFIYSISPNGNFNWGTDGIELTNDLGFNPSPKAVVNKEGNIVAMWEHEPADTSQLMSISLQKLSPDGYLLWNDVQITNDTAHCWMPRMIFTEDSCTIITWVESDKRDTTSPIGDWGFMHAFAQKIDANGNLLWDKPAVIDTINNMSLQPFYPSLAADGNGGLYVSWAAMATAFSHTCYVQHIDSQGTIQWTPNGLNVSDSVQFERLDPQVVSMQENGMAVFWNEVRPRSDYDWETAVMGQKLSINGERLWTTQGKLVDNWYNELETAVHLYDAKAVGEDFVLFFEHEYVEIVESDTLISSDLYATRIDSDANPVWGDSKTVFSNPPSWKLDLVVSDLSMDQWIAVWEDNRNDPNYEFMFGLYAQNISIDGQVGPVGIDQPIVSESQNLKVYPDPASDLVQLTYYMDTPGFIEINLFDVNGRRVKTVFSGFCPSSTLHQNIDLGGMESGIYLLQLKSNTNTLSKKLIKQ